MSLTLNFLTPQFTCLRKTHFTISYSQQTIQFDPLKNKKRKPKPSFNDQIREKWSLKKPSLSNKNLPWQNPDEKIQFQDNPIEIIEKDEVGSENLVVGVSESVNFGSGKRVHLPPWVHGNVAKETYLNEISLENEDKDEDKEEETNGLIKRESSGFVSWNRGSRVKSASLVNENFPKDAQFSGTSIGNEDKEEESIGLVERESSRVVSWNSADSVKSGSLVIGEIPKETRFSGISIENEDKFDGKGVSFVETDGTRIGFAKSRVEVESGREKLRVPWERENAGGERLINVNSGMAERLIPETELKRLRNVSKRMVERIKVGAAGVNQELVDSIRVRWREDEVVKMKFEGAPTLNLKRTHEALETRTGGIVIWRSGTSIALYRGMAYNLPCVQSYTHQTTNTHSSSPTESSFSRSSRYTNDLSEEEVTDLSELDCLLEDLGPRFKDWSGPEPKPVDADLLPSIVPGGRRPFRLLPNGIRQGLRDKETTFYRQSARRMPPHFALGRNRELQGLAMAMIKLWERSAIAKIAIKRGVHNTNNERMAEELKNLTGGVLLSRNKDFIVFYRGNDFLPSTVSQTLAEAQKVAVLKADEEEEVRHKASTLFFSNKTSPKIIHKVAGTLAETLAATSRWANQPSPEDRERMRRESALARHASMVKYLENKLTLANGKIKKAEKALAKVQESLSPVDLPTDLETITNEERFLFRKIGLSMKPYLHLGRRGMFDGTIENIHLHWKYREVVKLIVERKSFAQVKQIAIGLEAESGGVLVCVDKTVKGHVIILYRGKNYQRPNLIRPKNLLTKRQAWSRSIELQRREALKHHISDLIDKIEQLKAELKITTAVEEIDEETFYSRMDDASDDEETEEEGGEEMFINDNDSEDDIV